MMTSLQKILSQPVAGDNLPRNKGEYRIIEINTDAEMTQCRPRDWDYAFWGIWCFFADPVKVCQTKEDVLRFFEGYSIKEIDDSMSRKEYPVLEIGKDGNYHTITDTITLEMEDGQCYVIRDWERTQRAIRLFKIHTQNMPFAGIDEIPGWRFKDYLLP
jgi:hypothetical protein